jgi:hypothetical protein
MVIKLHKNVYLHVTQEMKKEASQKFTELMRSLRLFTSMVANYSHLTKRPIHIKGFRVLLHQVAHKLRVCNISNFLYRKCGILGFF